MKTERRWLKSAIAAANEPQITMPWARGARRRPASLTPASLTPASLTPPATKPMLAPKAIAAR